MTHIVFPSSATEQGFAFEDLILRHYHKSGQCQVREWSSYMHGRSGRWWQCDGVVEDDQGRYLIEAKFFADRPATVRDVNPGRRQAAARDLDCTGIRYISLNGFADDLLDGPRGNLDTQFLTWSDLRGDVLSGVKRYASALLDEFDLTETQAAAPTGAARLHFDPLAATPFLPQFAEFVAVPDSLEMWLRRMPCFPLQLEQLAAGRFWYDAASEQVTLISERLTDLSLQEAWAIQDALSGYANRTFKAIRATALALGQMTDGLIDDVQAVLHKMSWKTGLAGVRSSLQFLERLGLARKWIDGRRARYALLPLGKAYVLGGPDDALFKVILKDWLPYQAVCRAISEQQVQATSDEILDYFKKQYAPYEPYAHSLFNPNKAEGLVRLYKQFDGS
ncbi:MAG: hypothetical protein JW934_02395 [Anaerolineae bacterium]|nr:hypothetical protein [Anaerolineae bacterium]